MDRNGFFDWCAARGLLKSQDIAEVFRLSSQTVRNWDDKAGDAQMPAWVELACIVLDTDEDRAAAKTKFPPMTVTKLASWQRRHGFKTYEDTAAVFRLKRQAVHNWHKRGRFPRWLAFACAGYDARIQSKSSKDSVIAA